MKLRFWYTAALCLLFVFGASAFSSKPNDKIHYRDDEDVEDYENPCETVKVMPRIVGGSPVRSETSTPYIAAIGERLSNGSFTWYCGGSILSPFYILTAAHCLTSRNTDVVRVGSLSLNKKSCENDYPVAEKIIHPQYQAPKSYHDVAIIKVKSKIKFMDNIKPICLAEGNDNYDGRKAKVIGWGAEEVGGDGSQKLQKVGVEIFTNARCDEAYQNSTISHRTFPAGIRDGQLCAGSPRGGKDACQGDSGGPLVLSDNEGITRQIGVVSTGAGCGASVYPGVYARVSTYHSWVQSTINNTKSGSSTSSQGNNNGSENSSNGNTPAGIPLTSDGSTHSSYTDKDKYSSKETTNGRPGRGPPFGKGTAPNMSKERDQYSSRETTNGRPGRGPPFGKGTAPNMSKERDQYSSKEITNGKPGRGPPVARDTTNSKPRDGDRYSSKEITNSRLTGGPSTSREQYSSRETGNSRPGGLSSSRLTEGRGPSSRETTFTRPTDLGGI